MSCICWRLMRQIMFPRVQLESLIRKNGPLHPLITVRYFILLYMCQTFALSHWNSGLIEIRFFPRSLSSDIAAVKIVRHSISQIVESSVNQSHSSLILDCEYSYDPGDVKLVVRWFYNDSPEPIYQWIPSSDNRYVGDSIRPYFDMDYRIDDGDDRFTKYRAIRLIPNLNGRPSLPVTLSGKYTCIISSIMSQDSRHGQLTIYGTCLCNDRVCVSFHHIVPSF